MYIIYVNGLSNTDVHKWNGPVLGLASIKIHKGDPPFEKYSNFISLCRQQPFFSVHFLSVDSNPSKTQFLF